MALFFAMAIEFDKSNVFQLVVIIRTVDDRGDFQCSVREQE